MNDEELIAELRRAGAKLLCRDGNFDRYAGGLLKEAADRLDGRPATQAAELREVLRSLRCVQAGWAFGVPEDGQDQWLDLVAEAVVMKDRRAAAQVPDDVG